ncbi:MAG: 2-hydroxyacid dehydrogenase [Ilumatobacter sp.]
MSESRKRPSIVVTSPIPASGLELLHNVGDVWTWEGEGSVPIELRDDQLADADAVVTLLGDRVDDAFLDAAPNLKVVANVAVGYDNIDVAACAARGVVVTNTPDVLTDATADLAMALVLMTTRRLAEGERLLRSGEPWKWGMFMMLGSGLQQRRLGIIGMGGIGSALAKRATAFGMEIVYYNRHRVSAEVEASLGASLVSFDELLATSDVISVNCPYSADTHHLIDTAALAAMRPSAVLVNTARGAIVDEAALVAALESGEIAGAALDVFEHEPELHTGLRALDNVVLTPHLGSATQETRSAMADLAARNVASVLDGSGPLTPVS